MKKYTIPLSLVGAALALAGGLAYALNADAGALPAVNLGLGIALVAVAAALDPDLLRQYGRWINAFWGTLMILGILVMVNFLAERYHQRLDWTAGKLHSLSDLTLKTLENLDREVRAVAFMEKGQDEKLESLLKEYAVHSSHFSFEFVDPDRDPERTREYGVRLYNTLVIEAGERRESLTELKEKEITNALLKVLRERREVVYLTVGHGESGAGKGPRGLGRLEGRLKETSYEIEDSLFLARAGEVPENAAILLIAGPRTPFLAPEVDAVRAYLDRGGSVMVLLDPLYDGGLGDLLAGWGVHLGDDFVIDTSGIGSLFGLDYTTPVAVQYGQHPITEKHRGLMTFYEVARSVRFDAAGRAGLEGVELVQTSEQSWAESDVGVLRQKGNAKVQLDEGRDRRGPIPLAVAVRGAGKEGKAGRLVVFGDSDFETNRYFDVQGNGDLALNALSWLAEDESLISIRPREPGYNPIALNTSQAGWIFWISVVLYPLGVALLGLLVVSRKGRWSAAQLLAAGLGIALSLGVVALVNFLSDHYHYRADMTEGKLFTLSPDTKKLLGALETQDRYVKVKNFTSEGEGMRFQEIMDEYKYQTPRFDYEIVDPQKHALEVRQYNIRQRGSSVIEMTGGGKLRTERIGEQTEEALSNAIRRALKAEEHKIYLTGAHGEGSLTQVGNEGFSMLNGRLKEMNFQIEEGLHLEKGVPDDATIVAALGPRQPFGAAEVEALRAYLKKGRSVLLLLDPGFETGLEGLLGEYDIELGQDFVVDLSGLGQLLGYDVSVPVVLQYGDHPIVEKVAQGTMSFFPLARSVSVAGTHSRRQVVALALTHRSSWGETDLDPISGGDAKVEFDPEVDRRGPVSLAVAAEVPADTSAGGKGKAHLVVFGDSDFARNQYFGQQANGELLVGSLSWLAEGGEKLSITDKRPRFNPINLIGNAGTVVLWISVFILPFAVALSGLVIVLRRGYAARAGGFVSWLTYNFVGTALFFFIESVIGASEGSLKRGQGYLLVALLNAAVSYGLYQRDERIWVPALFLAVLDAGMGFAAIPHEVVQLIYAALFVVNAAILLWIRMAFQPGTEA